MALCEEYIDYFKLYFACFIEIFCIKIYYYICLGSKRTDELLLKFLGLTTKEAWMNISGLIKGAALKSF